MRGVVALDVMTSLCVTGAAVLGDCCSWRPERKVAYHEARLPYRTITPVTEYKENQDIEVSVAHHSNNSPINVMVYLSYRH